MYGKPVNSGENSNGTVHSSMIIPSEVFLFLAFTGIPGNFCTICPQLPVPGYFPARRRQCPRRRIQADESLLFHTVRDVSAVLFSRLLLTDFLQHTCSTQGEKDLSFGRRYLCFTFAFMTRAFDLLRLKD